jgi:DNA-binding CsgD family transcriptional regulator
MLTIKLEQPHLTPRELEILGLVANGFSAKEVANRLGIAPRTVERHTENVRMKMRARNRPHMVTLAISMGILLIEPWAPSPLNGDGTYEPADPDDTPWSPPLGGPLQLPQ